MEVSYHKTIFINLVLKSPWKSILYGQVILHMAFKTWLMMLIPETFLLRCIKELNHNFLITVYL